MLDSIEDVFSLLQKDVDQIVQSTSYLYLHNTSKLIVEKWANDIIEIVTSKALQPPLDEKTIERRKRRGNDILGPDYPLLETGEWITYIEFRINQLSDHVDIEVGVFDDTAQVGHTGSRSPVFIAEINEYGREDIHIPGRYLFSTSELKINSEIDNIIVDTWNNLSVLNLPEITQNSESLTGRIVSNGSEFIFRWNE